jgi:phosphoglycerate dehydrogenase-like enzyme
MKLALSHITSLPEKQLTQLKAWLGDATARFTLDEAKRLFPLQGKRLVIIGFSRVGKALAQMANAGGILVDYWTRTQRDKNLLRAADVISLQVPIDSQALTADDFR